MIAATGVVQLQGMGGNTVKHCCLSRANLQISAPNRHLTRFTDKHLARLFCDTAIGSGQRGAERIENVPLGLRHQGRRQIFKPQVHTELRQTL
nr:hypothetical protein GCM10020185_86220 [Pseudomonas brassicacearum subsp. brassicacearum]